MKLSFLIFLITLIAHVFGLYFVLIQRFDVAIACWGFPAGVGLGLSFQNIFTK